MPFFKARPGAPSARLSRGPFSSFPGAGRSEKLPRGEGNAESDFSDDGHPWRERDGGRRFFLLLRWRRRDPLLLLRGFSPPP